MFGGPPRMRVLWQARGQIKTANFGRETTLLGQKRRNRGGGRKHFWVVLISTTLHTPTHPPAIIQNRPIRPAGTQQEGSRKCGWTFVLELTNLIHFEICCTSLILGQKISSRIFSKYSTISTRNFAKTLAVFATTVVEGRRKKLCTNPWVLVFGRDCDCALTLIVKKKLEPQS